MSSTNTNAPLFVSAEGKREPMYKSEIINRRLVYAMFALALATLALVSFAVLTNQPLTGQPKDGPVVFERTLTLTGNGNAVTVLDEEGQVLLDTDNGGFLAVVIDGLERARFLAKSETNDPVTITQYENGRLSLYDPASDTTVELSSFGAGNLGVWQKLVTP